MEAQPAENPMLKVGTRLCQCGACLRYFNSPSAFDAHREDGACLDARAMKHKGMRVNARGYWVERGWDGGLSE
jgi:hypothetical protein